MHERRLFVTDTDRDRLEKLLLGTRQWSSRDKAHLQALEEELDKAHTVESREIPGDVVTMRSQVRVRDMKSGAEMDISVVFPSEADSEQGKISVLAPIGTALLGYRVGDVVEWKVPGGLRRLKVERILYQPEAAGHYHL
ncbi:MAG: GreA/GreB family elongation factor [candidate division NC10 bacterium]|nr:GreA/GreB family elongation factor [candidate division NC10 bacterium]